MTRPPLILAWLTAGAWAGATIRTALSADSDLTLIPLVLTIFFVLIAIRVTRKESHGVEPQDQ